MISSTFYCSKNTLHLHRSSFKSWPCLTEHPFHGITKYSAQTRNPSIVGCPEIEVVVSNEIEGAQSETYHFTSYDAHHRPMMHSVQTRKPQLNIYTFSSGRWSRRSRYTSLPKLVSNTCMWGVTACKVIGSSIFALGTTSSSFAIIPFSACRASDRLVSIGVFRTRISYDNSCGRGVETESSRSRKWSLAWRKCLPTDQPRQSNRIEEYEKSIHQ